MGGFWDFILTNVKLIRIIDYPDIFLLRAI